MATGSPGAVVVPIRATDEPGTGDARLEFSEDAVGKAGALAALGGQSSSTLYRLSVPKGPLVWAHVGRRRVWCRRSIRLYLLAQLDRERIEASP